MRHKMRIFLFWVISWGVPDRLPWRELLVRWCVITHVLLLAGWLGYFVGNAIMFPYSVLLAAPLGGFWGAGALKAYLLVTRQPR